MQAKGIRDQLSIRSRKLSTYGEVERRIVRLWQWRDESSKDTKEEREGVQTYSATSFFSPSKTSSSAIHNLHPGTHPPIALSLSLCSAESGNATM